MYRAVYRRDRLLGELQTKDNERYAWLVQKLGINWEPASKVLTERRSTKYGLFIMSVKAKAREERQEKLEALKKAFEIEKTKFYKLKEDVLNEINEEIKQLGFTDLNVNLNKPKNKRI
jgi:hypothetical protein